MSRNSIMNLTATIMLSLSFWVGAGSGTESTLASDECLIIQDRQGFSAVNECVYTLTARVRLLAIWISRAGVGEGRITWSEGNDGTQELALLIGSDPERAPMKVNRWGYIKESVSGSQSELIGVMTEAEEQSMQQARTNVSTSNGKYSFKAICSRTLDGTANSSVSYMNLDEDFTYRDVSTLLQRIPKDGARVRRLSLPEGAEPGFLFAVRSLVNESVCAYHNAYTLGETQHAVRRYVFSGTIYELKRKSSRIVKEIAIKNQTYRQLIESEFETRNLSTGHKSKFKITYGIRDAMAGIPVRITYRPRWWFEAEMLLDSESAAAKAVMGEAPWRTGTN